MRLEVPFVAPGVDINIMIHSCLRYSVPAGAKYVAGVKSAAGGVIEGPR